MREQVLILRDQDLEHNEASLHERMLRGVEVTSSRCGTATEQKPERIFSLNGAIRPRIPIDSGERQFWRMVNASPDLYAGLQLSGGQFEIVALDGMPLSHHDPQRSTLTDDHVLLPPAGREIGVSIRSGDLLAEASRSDTQPRFVRSSATELQMMQTDAVIGTARQIPTIPPISAPTPHVYRLWLPPMPLPRGYERLPRKYVCGVVPSMVRNISMKALTLS